MFEKWCSNWICSRNPANSLYLDENTVIFTINRTCVWICLKLNNYAAFDEIPWELNGYESTNSVLATNPYKIHHLSCKYGTLFEKWCSYWICCRNPANLLYSDEITKNLSIYCTCVCNCVELINYAAFDEIPWELNGYESTNFVLAKNLYKIHHLSWKYSNIIREMLL